MAAFDFPPQFSLEEYCLCIEKFLRCEFIEKMRLAYNLYDYNQDGKICINDAFQSMKNLGNYDFLI